MRKISLSIIFSVVFLLGMQNLHTQPQNADYDYVDSLLTIDYELRKMFPRWKVCEPDLQFQIYQAFSIYGYSKNELSIEEIVVLAAPKSPRDRTYEILMISCGNAQMNPQEIDQNIKQIANFLSGKDNYNRFERPDRTADPRTYCYIEIPPENPVKPSEATAIQNYLQPEDKIQAMTLSLFQQSLKIGETGFWLENNVGTDRVGYHFWSSGESQVILKRPLMNNTDSETREYVPRLINAYLGGGYRYTTGIDNDGTIFSWVPNRTLNAGPDGKFVGGLDVHMPFHPQFGVNINAQLPLSDLRTQSVSAGSYGYYDNPQIIGGSRVDFDRRDPRFNNENINKQGIAPLLRATGQFALFYNWWLGVERGGSPPSHYLRFDAGISYAQVDEYLLYSELDTVDRSRAHYLEKNGVTGLGTYKPSEFEDWLYLRVQYRNQQAFPFSVSLQYSNQILMARAYMPIFGNWFLLEGKYATPLRDIRPYEIDSFFMISPVFRITI